MSIGKGVVSVSLKYSILNISRVHLSLESDLVASGMHNRLEDLNIGDLISLGPHSLFSRPGVLDGDCLIILCEKY